MYAKSRTNGEKKACVRAEVTQEQNAYIRTKVAQNSKARTKVAQVAKKLMCAHPAAKNGWAHMLPCARTHQESVCILALFFL